MTMSAEGVVVAVYLISGEVLASLHVSPFSTGAQIKLALVAKTKSGGRLSALLILAGQCCTIGAAMHDTMTLEAAGLGGGGSLQAVIERWVQPGIYEAHPTCGYKDALSLSLTLYTLKVAEDMSFLFERRYSDADSDDEFDFSTMEQDAREACPRDISLRGRVGLDDSFTFEGSAVPPPDRLLLWLEAGNEGSIRRPMVRGVVREVMWADWGDGGWHDVVREFPLERVADCSGESRFDQDELSRLAEIAAARDAQLKRVIQEGRKRGVELADAAMTGGLQFISTAIIEPQGDTDLTVESMRAMHMGMSSDNEQLATSLKHIGKMIFSANQHQVSVVAQVPEALQDSVVCHDWLQFVLSVFDGVILSSSNELCAGKIFANEARGVRPLIIRDSLIVEANNYLRRKGLFPCDEDDDDFAVGDDDFLV